jgi:glycosyltransferase involved in cell wall biosynthesis
MGTAATLFSTGHHPPERAESYHRPGLDIVIPVHNEESSIESSLRELCEVLAATGKCKFRLIVCEDGSVDQTLPILERLAVDLPIRLVTSPRRKGYGRAVMDGLWESQADYCAVFEGDGQTDPRGIEILLDQIPGPDVVVGWRNPRSDHWFRKAMSWGFRGVYRRFFEVALTDPSYACMLIRGTLLRQVLPHIRGRMTQGFFWEFNAWCQALGLDIAEVPVSHRSRRHGKTRVYRASKVPGIALGHVAALFQLRRDIRALDPRAVSETGQALVQER